MPTLLPTASLLDVGAFITACLAEGARIRAAAHAQRIARSMAGDIPGCSAVLREMHRALARLDAHRDATVAAWGEMATALATH